MVITQANTLAPARQDLRHALADIGLQHGDVVYVASSLAALGMMDDAVGGTLWALREALGPEGTLVMPAFNFGFCKGEVFDPAQTPSTVGVLTEAFRQLPQVHRSWCPPFHSVCAVGPRAEAICATRSLSSFGPDCVFERLVQLRAKHVLIGCGYHDGVVHFHRLEEKHQVPYRYWRRFEGRVELDGSSMLNTFFMYVRREGVVLDAEPLGREFERSCSVESTTVGLCRLRAFDLVEFDRFVSGQLEADPLVLLKDRSHFVQTPRSPVTRIAHIGIVSRYAERMRSFLTTAGARLVYEGDVSALGVRCQYYEGMDYLLEVVDPIRSDSSVQRFLNSGGNSPLHHVAFEVPTLDEGLAYFKQQGYEPLDGQIHLGPRPYERVIFLSPVYTGGLLVELVATDGTLDDSYGGSH